MCFGDEYNSDEAVTNKIIVLLSYPSTLRDDLGLRWNVISSPDFFKMIE